MAFIERDTIDASNVVCIGRGRHGPIQGTGLSTSASLTGPKVTHFLGISPAGYPFWRFGTLASWPREPHGGIGGPGEPPPSLHSHSGDKPHVTPANTTQGLLSLPTKVGEQTGDVEKGRWTVLG